MTVALWFFIPQDWTWVDVQIEPDFKYVGLRFGRDINDDDNEDDGRPMDETLVEWWNHEVDDAIRLGVLDPNDFWSSAWQYYNDQKRPAKDVIIRSRCCRKVRGEWVYHWEIERNPGLAGTRRCWSATAWAKSKQPVNFVCVQCGNTRPTLYSYDGEPLIFCSQVCRTQRNRPLKKAA